MPRLPDPAEFKFIKVDPSKEIDVELIPDFLVIGPQRTGTTWLYQNLNKHPQVFMPQQKEIYFFNNLRSQKYHPADLPPVQQDLDWYLNFFRPPKDVLARRKKESKKKWGEPYEIAVRGEATATYAVKIADDADLMRELIALNPDIKILTMVRNPMDRAWSHAKKDLAKERNRHPDEVPESEWIEYMEQPYQVACGNYEAISHGWRTVLKEGHFFAGKFDDVSKDPEGLLLRAFEFLGIRADSKYVSSSATTRINTTKEAALPARVQTVLDRLYRGEVERLKSLSLIE